MNILIVEDEPHERELLEEQLREFGYDVTACATANAALQACQQTAFSLIILDLGLPDMDGLDLCRQIRALPQKEARMMLVITGRDAPGDLQQSLEAGVDDYLVKPVSAEQLRVRLTIIERRLHNYIRRRQTEKALSESLTYAERAKQEWEATADSLSQLICLLDSQGQILRINRTLERWNLGNVLNIKGRHIHNLFHPACSDPDCYLSKFLHRGWDAIAEGKMVDYEIDDPVLHRPLYIQLRPISTSPRKTQRTMESAAILVAEDISARRQLQNALSQQDRLLLGVAGAMDHLLVEANFNAAVSDALRTLGLAMNVDRVYLFESHEHPETRSPLMSQRFEWSRFSEQVTINAPGFQNIAYQIGLERWYNILSHNKTINSLVHDLPPSEQEFLAPQNIMSILLVPVMIQDRFWGFIGFDDCHSGRQWREEEEAVLFAMAGSIGGAIARQQVEEQLQHTSAELRAVFQSLPDEYFRLGADGSILDYKVNQGADLYLHPETFIGKWASSLLPEKVERQFDNAIAQVHRTKKLVTIDYRVPTADRTPRYEEIRLLPFLEDQLIVVGRDITARKLAEKELRQHRDHLEELVQERTAKLTETNQHLQQEIARRKQIEAALRELNQQLEDVSPSS